MADYNWSPSYNQDGQNLRWWPLPWTVLFVSSLHSKKKKKRDSVSEKKHGRLVPEPCDWVWKVKTSLPRERSFPDQYWYWLTHASKTSTVDRNGKTWTAIDIGGERERERKRERERVHDVEGPACATTFKRLANLRSEKLDCPYAAMLNWLWCRVLFALLWSAVTSLWGSRRCLNLPAIQPLLALTESRLSKSLWFHAQDYPVQQVFFRSLNNSHSLFFCFLVSSSCCPIFLSILSSRLSVLYGEINHFSREREFLQFLLHFHSFPSALCKDYLF